jgi:hypothetical protein
MVARHQVNYVHKYRDKTDSGSPAHVESNISSETFDPFSVRHNFYRNRLMASTSGSGKVWGEDGRHQIPTDLGARAYHGQCYRT